MHEQPRPLVIAHRGASGYRPEHSRSAYELAIRLGADAIEPDLVATRDGVLVIRHENEISGTTDVAAHPEFAHRRTTKVIDGHRLTGWFTEDFTWDELRTLRVMERLPDVRPGNTEYDGREGMLRLSDLLELLDETVASGAGAPLLVAELKHATHFADAGLPLDELFADAIKGWSGRDHIVVESFEQTVLDRLRDRGVPGLRVYLVEASGTAADLRASHGKDAPSYAEQLSDEGLARLARQVHGISVPKSMLLKADAAASGLIEGAHARGLSVFAWTLRPENRFLAKRFRANGGDAAWGDWRSEFAAILRTGVDGVFADHPDLALEARAALAGV